MLYLSLLKQRHNHFSFYGVWGAGSYITKTKKTKKLKNYVNPI